MTVATTPPREPRLERPAPAERPQRAAGLELLGRFEDSGFKEPPYLARRRDGQIIQLSRLLYLVADAVDGRRDANAIAATVGATVGRRVSADNVMFLVEHKLRPLGVLAGADGSTPALSKRPPLLALRCRRPLVPERAVRALGLAFAPLFVAPIVVLVLAGLAAFDVWLFGMHGIVPGLRAVLYEPALLLALVAGVIAATAFHEIGHAAACRYGGARPGAIGVGLYLVWPAFYCDVTDAYRLDRRGRLRTDLGGIYFNSIVALLAGGAYFATGQEALLLLAVVQHLAMLQQLLPILRFDGYYVLSDLTGVPDILSRIGPILRSLVPFRPAEPKVRELKPWVRLVVTVYLVLLVPVLAVLLLWMVLGAPRVFATAADAAGLHAARVAEAFRRGDWSLTALSSLQIAALALQCGAIALVIARTGRATGRRLMHWSQGSVRRRAVVVAGTIAVAGFVVAVWWPDGDYRPLQPGERGTIPEGISGLREIPDSRPTSSGQLARSRITTVGAAPNERGGRRPPGDGGSQTGVAPPRLEPDDQPRAPSPGPRRPAPVEPPARQAPPNGTATPPPTTASAPPDVPAPTPTAPSGDNAAVATNTQDGALAFRLAFDLQYILGGGIDQSNTALAYARCEGCRTIAVAIQVLIASGDLDIIQPTNLAAAINDHCTSCQTLAYAYQLVLALPDLRQLTDAGRARIAAILAAIVVLGASDIPIDELRARLDGLMVDLRDVVATELEHVEPAADGSSPEPTATTTPDPTATAAPSEPAPPADDPTATPPPDDTSTATPDPTATPTPTPDQTATPTPTPEATGTPVPDATATPEPTAGPAPTP